MDKNPTKNKNGLSWEMGSKGLDGFQSDLKQTELKIRP